MPAPPSESETQSHATTGRSEGRTIVTQSEAVLQAGDFGEKTIGMAAGFCLMVNNVTGPGLVEMAQAITKGGWLVVTLVLFVCWTLSSLSCTMMLEAIKKIPGNSKFDQRIEFTTLAKYHFTQQGRDWMFLVTLGIFLLSFLTTLIASVIESAQTMDKTIIAVFGSSCAFQIHNTTSDNVHGTGSLGFVCTSTSNDDASPFGKDAFVVSLGYAVVLLFALPLGYWNLDDNVWVQVAAFVVVWLIVGEWAIQAFIDGIDYSKPPGEVKAVDSDYSVLGAVLFNYAFVTAAPSWCNEKKVGVDINNTVWGAAGLGTVMFLICGLIPAGAWDFSGDNDLLTVLTSEDTPGVSKLTKALTYLFPSFALVTSIPIFSIIVRYNLIENNICGKFWANFWATLFPWIASIGLYAGDGLDIVLTWAGLITIVPLNFVLPAYFYLLVLDSGKPEEGDPESPLINANSVSYDGQEVGVYEADEEVDMWVPGHQWVPGVVVRRQGDSCNYILRPADADALPFTTLEVEASNLRQRRIHQRYNVYDQIKEEHFWGNGRVDARKLVEQRHMTTLQRRLDKYEQKIAEQREAVAALVVQYPKDDPIQQKKEQYHKEMKRLQRKVNRVIDEMEELKAGTYRLTPAQRDELFVALPHSWSRRVKAGLACTIIIVSIILNIVALVYVLV